MNDEDRLLQSQLQRAQRESQEGLVPDFDAVWAAAEKRAATRWRNGRIAGVAVAATVLALLTVRLPGPAEQDWQYVNPDDLESSTSWVAPSDVLLPEHRVDIYREIPVLIESTKIEEGALL